jgi:hypothetical protein
MRTTLPQPGCELAHDSRMVFDSYATRWLLVDLVAIAPWDVLVAALAISKGHYPAALLLKVAKLPRLLRLRLLFAGSENHGGSASSLVRVGVFMSCFLILAHWGACAMWAISRAQVEYSVGNGIGMQTGLTPMALIDHRRGVTYSAEADAMQQQARCSLQPARLALMRGPSSAPAARCQALCCPPGPNGRCTAQTYLPSMSRWRTTH